MDKTLARAARQGHHLEVVELPGRHTLVAGPISLDMKLHDTLHAFNGYNARALEPGAVLNYNPHRRVVFRIETAAGPVVCKAGPTNPAETAFLAELTARGVPVLQRMSPPDMPHTSTLRYYPWFGQGDLHQAAGRRDHTAAGSAHSAGAALALLHAQPAHLAPKRRSDPLDKLRSLSKRKLHLTPTNQTRLGRVQAALARRLSEGDRAVLVHGDFSADQVLVDSPGVLLADFDRCTVAPPAMDLGSFVAVDLLQARTSSRELRSDFLTGYEEAGGHVNEESLLAWTAVHLLDRLNEPFRSCSPFWQDETEERLEMLAALVS
ncbi:phosphotransferase family protein [Arthrobacter agilis]|uniref:phosphotransferase n=1 Tax=Arthrobacter agilis TaxID=37921 RepID=UPI001304E1DE|nr:phosphotransferase [Arthrobacter agilis]